MTEENNKPTFEDALSELREAVQALEAGGVSLEEATVLFERGINLAKTCNELLSAAELQVTRLQRSFTEQMAKIDADQQAEEPGDSG